MEQVVHKRVRVLRRVLGHYVEMFVIVYSFSSDEIWKNREIKVGMRTKMLEEGLFSMREILGNLLERPKL